MRRSAVTSVTATRESVYAFHINNHSFRFGTLEVLIRRSDSSFSFYYFRHQYVTVGLATIDASWLSSGGGFPPGWHGSESQARIVLLMS